MAFFLKLSYSKKTYTHTRDDYCNPLCACAPRVNYLVITLYMYNLIYYKNEKTFKNEQRNRDDAAKNRANTSGVGESNNYYEDIYN